MQTEIQPELTETQVTCGCGNEFVMYSTEEELVVEICSDCHPFYTGQQRYVDSEGRVEKFQDKYDWDEDLASEIAGHTSSESDESGAEEGEEEQQEEE